MRSILIGSAAAILAISTASSPAYAQYGGSPDDQVEQDYDNDVEDAREAADEMRDDAADAAEDAGDMAPEDQGAFEDAGPPPEDAYRDDADQDVDVDADQDVDQDLEDEGQTWRGEDGRNYCRRSDGTTGLIVGGGAGALVGRGIDSHGRRGTGTILGAIAGAVVGSAIERSANDQRCR